MKKLGTLRIHSIIDLITNSSTEIFIENIKEDKQIIQQIINEVISELGCTAININIENSWDSKLDNYAKDRYDIYYDYECYHEPCNHIKTLIKQKLGIND